MVENKGPVPFSESGFKLECFRMEKVIDYRFAVETVRLRIQIPIPCKPFECDGFQEYPNNPVYDPYPLLAYYQTVRFDERQFTPYGPAAYYKMWYDNAPLGNIDLATSPDGIHWTFLDHTTGLGVGGPPPFARHSRVLFDRNWFGTGNPNYAYRIWYWAGHVTQTLAIRTAHSADGVNWLDDQYLGQSLSAPLISGSGLLGFTYGPDDVLFYPENPGMDTTNPFNRPPSPGVPFVYGGEEGPFLHGAIMVSYHREGNHYRQNETAYDPGGNLCFSPADGLGLPGCTELHQPGGL